MSERYFFKITYRLTVEQAQKAFGWLSDDPRINQTQTILLDAVEDNVVTLDSTISTHPQLNGTEVADHMYRNPANEAISGAFGIFSSNVIDTQGNGNNVKLRWIQDLFEFLKDNGIVCKLSKIAQEDNKSFTRFKVRSNMVLQSITWTEKLASMSFSLNFVEVQLAKIQEYHVDQSDSFLPSIDILQSISFTQEMLDWYTVLSMVVAIGIECEFIDARIVEEAMGTVGVYTGIGLGAGIASIYVLAGIAGGVSSIPVAGWIVAGVIAVGIIGYGIAQAIKQAMQSKKFKEDQIKYFGNDVKDREQVERLNNFLSNISKQLVRLDDSIIAYSMTITEPCQFYVNFENNYYLCEVQNNAPNGEQVSEEVNKGRRGAFHAFILKDLDGHPLGKWVRIETANDDLFQCNSGNCIYRLPYSGSYVYLLRKYNYYAANHSFSGGGRRIDDGGSSSTYSTIKPGSPTDTYYLVATKIAPEKFSNVIEDIVIEAIMR